MTIDDISQTQIDQIPTDFQAFLDKRSRRSGQCKRRGVKLFRKAGTLPSDEHILDFAHGYYDADPVAEAFVKDAYIDGNPSHGRAMLDQALEHGIESVPDAPASMVITAGGCQAATGATTETVSTAAIMRESSAPVWRACVDLNSMFAPP